MTRRQLLAATLGCAVAPKAVLKAGDVLPVRASNANSALTPKQAEVLRALHDGTPCVLFSGSRACGKSHIARIWAKQAKALVVVPSYWHADWWRRQNGRGANVITEDDLWARARASAVPLSPFPGAVVVDNAHDLQPGTLGLIHGWLGYGKSVLYTAVPSGPGMSFLRRKFSLVGWNGPSRYHVNASFRDNPFLDRLFVGRMEAMIAERDA